MDSDGYQNILFDNDIFDLFAFLVSSSPRPKTRSETFDLLANINLIGLIELVNSSPVSKIMIPDISLQTSFYQGVHQ